MSEFKKYSYKPRLGRLMWIPFVFASVGYFFTWTASAGVPGFLYWIFNLIALVLYLIVLCMVAGLYVGVTGNTYIELSQNDLMIPGYLFRKRPPPISLTSITHVEKIDKGLLSHAAITHASGKALVFCSAFKNQVWFEEFMNDLDNRIHIP